MSNWKSAFSEVQCEILTKELNRIIKAAESCWDGSGIASRYQMELEDLIECLGGDR